jgi:LPXTG-motif cell wall-anchored protein
MVRRALLLSLALLLTVFAPAAVAQTEYDGTSASGSVTADGIVIAGEGFNANATVTYEVEYNGSEVESGTAMADAEGDVSFVIRNRGEGSYVVVLSDGTNSATTTVVVGGAGAAPAAPAAGGGALPRTGADESVGLAQVGIAALALGAVAIYAGKRRRANAWSA